MFPIDLKTNLMHVIVDPDLLPIPSRKRALGSYNNFLRSPAIQDETKSELMICIFKQKN